MKAFAGHARERKKPARLRDKTNDYREVISHADELRSTVLCFQVSEALTVGTFLGPPLTGSLPATQVFLQPTYLPECALDVSAETDRDERED